MSKKRVHEIAKELKDSHGIELDNKAVVHELVSLGYDVKSHSSSLEDDQAVAAVQRIVDKLKPKTPPPAVAPKGFVVRRKVGDFVQSTLVAPGSALAGGHAAGEVAARPVAGPSVSAPPVPALEVEAMAPPPALVGQPGEAGPVTAQAVEAPVADEAAPAPELPTAASVPASPEAPVEAPAARGPDEAAAAGVTGAPPPSSGVTETPAPVVASAATPAAGVILPPGATVRAGAAIARPAVTGTVPFRPSGLPPMSALLQPPVRAQPAGAVASAAAAQSRPGARGPAPRVSGPGVFRPSAPRTPGADAAAGAVTPSTVRPQGAAVPRVSAPRTVGGIVPRTVVSMSGPGAGVPGGVGQAPARPLQPTATQAVIVSRPLIAVRRVTPTQAPGSRYPMAPGRKAIGEVREFKVVPNQFGAGPRDFIDVNKAKENQRRGGGRHAKEKETATTTTDIREIVFGRVAIPIRGKKKKPTKKGQKTLITEMAEEKKVIKVQEGVTVNDLSQRMGVRTADLVRKLMAGGKMFTANQLIDGDTAALLAADYGWTVKKVGMEVEDFMPKFQESETDFVARPPVVTVMGHVDHGKTSLLDAIRSANVASGEAGGITQHIGAYTVSSRAGDITFLDTPGHEAFSAMRSRGANITDVVVLVVAADDGVMPQTKEAVQHALKAEVPLVVAINKMDLTGANPDRVKKELADLSLLAEDWGGEVIMVPVSAKTRQGLDSLLESIALQAEVLELKANPSRPAQGTVIEARLEKGRGPVATVLVQEGTLKRGDAIVVGMHYGRVRMMLDSEGELVEEVRPGYSAEVIGLSGVPSAGEIIHAVGDEKAAKAIADHRSLKLRQAEAGKTSRETLDDLLAKQKAADQKELKIILKADVAGSLEAVAEAVQKLATKKVKVTIVQKGVGMMTETDINNAAAFQAVVIGFNSRPESGSEAAAKTLGVRWETFGIIYELLEGVTRMMEDLLEPIRNEKRLGRAEVRNLFNVPKLGVIAGSSVLEGTIKRSAHLRLWRANKQLFQGKLASLKRFKDDVKEVGVGYECGIGIENFAEMQPGDIIEAFEIEETRPSLN